MDNDDERNARASVTIIYAALAISGRAILPVPAGINNTYITGIIRGGTRHGRRCLQGRAISPAPKPRAISRAAPLALLAGATATDLPARGTITSASRAW